MVDVMSEKDWHIAELLDGPAVAAPVVPGDDVIQSTAAAIVIERADCCPANPAFRAVLPARGERTRPTELLLCGHHLRASQDALAGAGAAVYDPSGRLVSSAG
jgi:hypothetical protein